MNCVSNIERRIIGPSIYKQIIRIKISEVLVMRFTLYLRRMADKSPEMSPARKVSKKIQQWTIDILQYCTMDTIYVA